MILYEDPKVIVEYDPIIPCVIWTPIDFMSGDAFREPFNKGMEFYEEKIKEIPTIGWLNDTRKLKTVRIDDVKWIDDAVNIRGLKAGVKKVAFVLPENVFGRMGTRLYVEFTTRRPDNTMEIKAFKTIAEAKLWLKGTAVTSRLDEIKL